MRNIGKVMDEISIATPSEMVEIHKDLEWLGNRMIYTAPEAVVHLWDNLALIINNHIPYPPVEDWQKEVVDIFTDQKKQEQEGDKNGN